MKSKFVDIFIPYWGDFKLLKKAVDSVLAQTDKDFNLIIADDKYPSKEAFEFYKDNPNLTYIRHEENLGITKNFNFCLDYAKSKYTVIMGCDDIMLPNYVETLKKNHDEADIYQPHVDIIDADDQKYLPLTDKIKRLLQPKGSKIVKGQNLATSLSFGNWLYFPSIAWKTATLQKYRFNEDYKIVEDLDMEFNIILNGGTLKIDKTTTFLYRRFDESLSSKEKSGVRFTEEKTVYDDFAEKFKNKGWKIASHSSKLRLTSRINQLLSR